MGMKLVMLANHVDQRMVELELADEKAKAILITSHGKINIANIWVGDHEIVTISIIKYLRVRIAHF